MGALADLASAITSAPTLPRDDDNSRGGFLDAYRHWLREREALAAGLVEVGPADIDAAIDSGARLLVVRGAHDDPTTSRAVISLLTGAEPNTVVHQTMGMSDEEWMRQVIQVRDRVTDLRTHQGDIEALLDAVPAAAAIARGLITASARRTPVLLEGLTTWAAGVAADRLSFRAKTWWHGAGTSMDPAIHAAVTRIGIEPGLDLQLPTNSVVGARVHAALAAVD